MSIKSDYQEYLKKKKTISEKRTGKFWMNQEERYVKPFQIYGNLYYVGDSWVCVHIVDTGEGLLMFDAGNCGATAMLVQSKFSWFYICCFHAYFSPSLNDGSQRDVSIRIPPFFVR